MSRKRRASPQDPPKVWLSHTHRSSFFWKSKLTPERMDAIIAWLEGLPDENKSMINDLLDDVRADTIWNEEDLHSQ